MNSTDQRNLKGKRISAYARFSSDAQNEKSADDQLARCVEKATSHGGRVATENEIKDEAISGASTKRPGFERLMAMVRARQVDVIVVEDMDRLSRDLSDSAFIMKELAFYDVELITVSDGMSSRSPSAKTHFLLKGFMSEQFLDNLRDKTLRGQLACFKAGFATGAVPYGYRTTPKLDPYGKTIAHIIHINDEQAVIVRRIFAEHLAGRSLALITSGLNADRVPAPRSMKRKGAPEWGDSTVRSILHNEVYVGTWRFGLKQWVKEPGTNKRVPKDRPANEIPPEQNRPHLRIIDDETWQAVQARLAAIRQHYTKNGIKKGGSIPGKNTSYLLSGMLVCECGALMFINGGNNYRRYRCTANARRGTCPNRVTVAEPIARRRIVEALNKALLNEFAIKYEKQIRSQRSGRGGRKIDNSLKTKRAELQKAEARIRNLVDQTADGGADEYVRDRLKELATEAKQLKQAIAALEFKASAPPEPAKPKAIQAHVENLLAFFDRDVLAGREYLRKLLNGKSIHLSVGSDGIYRAETEVFPMVLLTEPPPPVDPEGAVSSACCGGRI